MKYDLSHRDWIILEENGWINDCGGKGGLNFSQIMETIKYLPYFNDEKTHKLIKELNQLCRFHDITFSLSGGIIDFCKANLCLTYGIFKLLSWTHLISRIGVFIVILVGLTRYGPKYFVWGKKRTLKYLLNNKNV